jgi:hypothetical protein
LRWSLGSAIFKLSQWCGDGFGYYRKETGVVRIPLTAAQVREHFPDTGVEFWANEAEVEEASEE